MTGRPKMCPSCGKLMGSGNECPYCGADVRSLGSRFKKLSRAASSEDVGHPFTFGLLVVMVGIYLATIAFGGIQKDGGGLTTLYSPTVDAQIRVGAMATWLVDQGDWWRIITGNFLHWGVIHLLMNSLSIYLFGRAYEEEVGPLQTFNLFMLTGIAGFLTSYAFRDIGLVAGASAGGFGLMGCIIGRRWMMDGHLRDPLTMRAITLAVTSFILGVALGADNLAHAGGLVAGVAVAWLQARFERARMVWLGVGIVLAGLVITSGIMAFALPQRYIPLEVARRAQGCAMQAIGAISQNTGSLLVQEAEEAEQCFAELPDMSGATPSVDAMRAGLRRAIKGRTSGSFSEEREGINDYVRNLQVFGDWIAHNYQRE